MLLKNQKEYSYIRKGKNPFLHAYSRCLNLLLFLVQHLSWRPRIYIHQRIFMFEASQLAFVVSCSSSSVTTALDIGGTFLIHIGSSRQWKAFKALMPETAYLLLIVLGHFQKILTICPWASLSYSLANYTDVHAVIYSSFVPKNYLA